MFEGKTAAYLVRDALRDYSDAYSIVNASDPLQIRLNGLEYFLLINRTHDSGEGRVNDDECRIQIGPNQLKTNKPFYTSGKSVMVLGYEPMYGVFTVWESQHVLQRKPSTFSVYSRFSRLKAAQIAGISSYTFRSQILKRKSKAINFMPEYLGLVLENRTKIFQLTPEELQDVSGFFAGTSTSKANSSDDLDAVGTDIRGERIEVTRVEYPRDPSFRREVMRAYKSKCCVCGIQLAMVDAAHIIPHSEHGSDNTVSNGLALCGNHHRAYDSSLLIPHEDFILRINEERAHYLLDNQLGDEIEQLRAFHGQEIMLPSDLADYPDKHKLTKGRVFRQA